MTQGSKSSALPPPELVDLAAIAKQRDRHPQGGGGWQRWQRIYEVCEAYVREHAQRGVG